MICWLDYAATFGRDGKSCSFQVIFGLSEAGAQVLSKILAYHPASFSSSSQFLASAQASALASVSAPASA